MDELGELWALEWMRQSAADISRARIDLIELDRAIGDGDHGENLDRGFSAIMAKLDENAASAADVFKLAASTLISTVGGAAGPLYGTAFLRGSKAASERGTLDAAGVAEFVQACLDGIVHRGKAEVGDKTMVDAWAPAAEAAKASAENGGSAKDALVAAAKAAQEGAVATEPLVAKKGRASYLGERSAGHRDPGAESSAILLAAAARAAGGEVE